MENYTWPGNIRELRNVVERIIILEKGRRIDRAMLEAHIGKEIESNLNLPVIAHKTSDQAERELIYRVLLDIRMAVEDIHTFILGQPARTYNGTNLRSPFQAEVTTQTSPLPDDERTLKEIEKIHIEKTLDRCGGNRRKAAKSLGIGERTLYRKLKEYGLD